MQAYHGGINTNNHVESMNKVLKTKWLLDRVDHRLDSLIKMWVNVICPYYHDKYKLDNVTSAR